MKAIFKAYYNWLGARRYANLINMTKAEWINWWESTGLFDMRGVGVGCVFMKRIDTDKPFQLDNISLMQRTGKRGGVKEVKVVHRGWDNVGWDLK